MKFERDSLSGVYLSSSIRTFGLSLLGIFIPLYIYQVLSNQQVFAARTALLLGVFGYYIVHRIFLLIATLPAAYFIAEVKGGFRKAMLLSNLLHAGNLLLLIFAKNDPWLLLPAAILGGVLIPFYWIPFHLIFVEDGQRRKFGQQISNRAVLDKAATIIAPFTGGLVIAFFGFTTLLVAVLLLVVASTFPIFLMAHHEKHFVPPLKMLFAKFLGEFRSDLAAFLGAGAESVGAAIVWPLFLFTIVGSFAGLGALTSGVMLISMLVVWKLGKVVDQKDKKKILRAGAYSRSVLWLVRAFVGTVPQAFAAQSLARVAAEFLWLPFDTIVYKKAYDGNPFEYILLREWALNWGRLLTLLAMAALVWLGLGLVGSFALAAAGTLLTILIAR